LERPASSKLSASLEIHLLRTLAYLCAYVASRCRNVGWVYVAFSCTMVPAEHVINGLCELGVIPLVNTAGVDPKVTQIITSGLLSAEHDLTVASFILTIPIYHVEEGDFFSPPSMRKDSVGWYVVLANFYRGKLAVSIQCQKTHNVQDTHKNVKVCELVSEFAGRVETIARSVEEQRVR
jgi:hypothetical protein